MSDSQNVFLTKSWWVPVCTMLVSKVTLVTQKWFELTPDDQAVIIAALTAVAIALVRSITNRPAHIFKPKPKENNFPGDSR